MIGALSPNFSRRIYLQLLGIGVITVIGLGAVVIFLTHRIDEQARLDTREKHALLLSEWQKTLTLAAEDYAYWTLAHQIIRDRDDDAVYDMLGSGASEGDLFDWLCILEPDGSLLYSFTSDNVISPEKVLTPDVLDPLLAPLLQSDPAAYQSFEGYIPWGDGLSLAAVVWVTPDDLTGVNTAKLPVMIGGKMLGTAALNTLSTVTDAVQLRVMRSQISTMNDAMALKGPSGTAGWLAWAAQRPGSELRADVLPWISAVSLVALFIAAWTARNFHNLARRLDIALDLATTDALTGLLNRGGLDAVLQRPAMTKALARGHIAVVSIDLNRLKEVNDTYGHMAGDHALKVIADRLQRAVGPSDHLARIGGDEFVCLIENSDPQQAAQTLATRITTFSDEPIDFGGFTKVLRTSVGIAVGARGDDFATLMAQSDAAMYQAKRRENPDAS